MADDVRISADDFLKASKALKAAGNTEMRKALNKSLRDAAKPLIPKTRAAALRMLPARGGLARAVSRAPQRVQVRTGQDTAGVRLVVGARRGSGAAAANAGKIRHPVFDTGVFVEQSVPAGWYDDTLEREAPGVRPDVESAIRSVLEQIARGS